MITAETIKAVSDEGYRNGINVERERIIQLLEDFYDGNLWRQIGPDEWEGFDMQEVIVLIKGENNE